jgi:maltooligosyltrehalose synthase
MIVLAGRFLLRMFNGHPAPIGDVWGSTVVTLPKKIEQRVFQEVFSGEEIAADANNGRVTIPLAKAFAHAPVALLIGHNNT